MTDAYRCVRVEERPAQAYAIANAASGMTHKIVAAMAGKRCRRSSCALSTVHSATISSNKIVIIAKYQLTKACSKKKSVNPPQFFSDGSLSARTRNKAQNGIHSKDRIWRWLMW